MDEYQKSLLEQVAGLHEVPAGHIIYAPTDRQQAGSQQSILKL